MMDRAIVDIELDLLLESIYLTYHYDFRRYSAASLKRRVAVALPHFKCETISRLQERVVHEPRLFARNVSTRLRQGRDEFYVACTGANAIGGD